MSKNRPTLVIGASENRSRYSHIAVQRLVNNGHTVYAFSNQSGMIGETPIHTKWPADQDVHTVTIYINPSIQSDYQQQIIDLQPKRVIFNPGTENPPFYELLKKHGIDVITACTLVLLSSGQYV